MWFINSTKSKTKTKQTKISRQSRVYTNRMRRLNKKRKVNRKRRLNKVPTANRKWTTNIIKTANNPSTMPNLILIIIKSTNRTSTTLLSSVKVKIRTLIKLVASKMMTWWTIKTMSMNTLRTSLRWRKGCSRRVTSQDCPCRRPFPNLMAWLTNYKRPRNSQTTTLFIGTLIRETCSKRQNSSVIAFYMHTIPKEKHNQATTRRIRNIFTKPIIVR